MHTSVIDHNCFKNLLLDERCSVAFGQPCSTTLLQEVQGAVQKLDRGFYDMIDVTLANVTRKLSDWFKGKPLGEISAELERALQEDIKRDVVGFIYTIQDSPVTLRLVVDTSSGFEELREVLDHADIEESDSRIESIISKLEYDRAYLFHTDEDVVNQIKSYCGATTLGIDPCSIEQAPGLDQWFSLFSGEGSLQELAADAVSRGDRAGLEDAIKMTMHKAWRFQVELPGLAKPGTLPYRFLLGAPHLYFGAPEKLDHLGHALPKSALHAKPLIWARNPSAKRFLTLLDSPGDFHLASR
jgi:hypothetical protein